jgi:hypothetical protein
MEFKFQGSDYEQRLLDTEVDASTSP